MPNENLIFQEWEVLQELSVLYKHLMESHNKLTTDGISTKSSFLLKILLGTALFWFLWKHLYSSCIVSKNLQSNDSIPFNITF